MGPPLAEPHRPLTVPPASAHSPPDGGVGTRRRRPRGVGDHQAACAGCEWSRGRCSSLVPAAVAATTLERPDRQPPALPAAAAHRRCSAGWGWWSAGCAPPPPPEAGRDPHRPARRPRPLGAIGLAATLFWLKPFVATSAALDALNADGPVTRHRLPQRDDVRAGGVADRGARCCTRAPASTHARTPCWPRRWPTRATASWSPSARSTSSCSASMPPTRT